jgi:hypothetical protein
MAKKNVSMKVSTIGTALVSGINRNQTPQEALNATDFAQCTAQSVVDTMPHGEGEEVELKFFKLNYCSTPTELDTEYERRGLKADPFALAKYMEANPAFVDESPVACQWDLDENGRSSFAVFNRWGGGRGVSVRRSGYRWDHFYRFAGVCK